MLRINREQAKATIQFWVVLIIAGSIGSFFIIGGSIQYNSPAPPISSGYTDFYIIHFADQSTGKIILNLSGGTFGLTAIQYNPIKIVVAAQINEPTRNSTIIEAEFPHASISTSDKETQMENRIVRLQYNSNQDYGQNSSYSVQPTLSYLYGGQFDVVLNITNAKTLMLEKEYGTKQNTEIFVLPSVITIQSVDSYLNMQYSQRNLGLTLMIVGISIVISGSVAAALVDYFISALPSRLPMNLAGLSKSVNSENHVVNSNTSVNQKYTRSSGPPMDIAKEKNGY